VDTFAFLLATLLLSFSKNARRMPRVELENRIEASFSHFLGTEFDPRFILLIHVRVAFVDCIPVIQEGTNHSFRGD
jgi:hypothetical protein